jgi:hypothetical protein
MNEARDRQLRAPAEGVSFSAECSRVGGLYRLESVPVEQITAACVRLAGDAPARRALEQQGLEVSDGGIFVLFWQMR